MKNNAKKILKAGVVLFIAVLFVGMSTTAIGATPEKATFVSTKKTATISDPSREEIELKYYNPDDLTNSVGLTGGSPPFTWKSGIRLTQDELAAYSDWTLTSVVVGADCDNGQPEIDVRIYIYNEGTHKKPGSIITKNTTYHFSASELATIPLVDPVPLTGHNELWVAVEWTQLESGTYIAVGDSGPHIYGKSDWTYMNAAWQSVYNASSGTIDTNWAIGAVVEGAGIAELSILNIKGPIGINADVKNIGVNNASNLEWSIAVTGGLLKLVNKTATGTAASLAAGATEPISLGMFFGFGKISIVIIARASNAVEVSTTKSAFLLGPLVIGIK